MRPLAFQLTPQGFRVPLYDQQRRGDGPDEFVVKAYRTLMCDASGITHTWDYKRKIINRGLDLLGDFREFLKAQDGKDSLTVHQRAFLEDTIQFINTGRRPMTINTRVLLLVTEASEKNPKTFVASRSTKKLADMLQVPNDDYMFHWLQHRDGFGDMVCTLNVIFGDPKDNNSVSR